MSSALSGYLRVDWIPQESTSTDTDPTDSDTTSQSRKKPSVGVISGIAVVVLLVGIAIRYLAIQGDNTSTTWGTREQAELTEAESDTSANETAAKRIDPNKTEFTEAELDTPIGSCTYNGQTETITVREVIENEGTRETATNSSGNYNVPSHENVYQEARNKLCEMDAEQKGLSVSDDEMATFSRERLGSSDYEHIAESYSMDVESVKAAIKRSATMEKLRKEIVDESNLGNAPEVPVAPDIKSGSDQDQVYNEPRKEYADYIIALAGDQWDSEKGSWRDEESSYATALSEYKMTKDGASYNAAQAAYYVAYQEYSEEISETTKIWEDYVNQLSRNATIEIYV